MGWVTLSLRKMALKQRVSMLQYRLVTISQQKQTAANQSQYQQRAFNIEKNQGIRGIDQSYYSTVQGLNQDNAETSTTDTAAWNTYQNSLDAASMNQAMQRSVFDSEYEAKESILMDEINRKEQQLDAEQIQIETQIKAAEAELKSLDEAIDESIDSSAPKFT